MICVFEDGRVLYDDSLLDDYSDEYLAVSELPHVEEKEGMCINYKANLETGKIDWFYTEIEPIPPEPEPIPPVPIPPKPYQPTEGELLIMKSQAAMYEELQESKLSQMKANADIYEAILSNGGTI